MNFDKVISYKLLHRMSKKYWTG